MTSSGQFIELTESWGMPMPETERDMVYRRYAYLADVAGTGSILEVGCGQALGNDLLTADGRFVASFDLDMDNVRAATRHTGGAFGVADAQQLPIADGSVDAVAAFEMMYYVPDQQKMVDEMRRVLRPGGAAFIAVANPERPSFHESPQSTHYPNARELASMLRRAGLQPELFGVFPLEMGTRAKVFRLAAGVATKLHLVPRTMKGRNRLKRVLRPILGESAAFEGLDESARRDDEISRPVPVQANRAVREFRVLYAIGRLDA